MSAMATTQTPGGVKKIRSGRRPTVQDAGIAAARLRSGRNGHDNGGGNGHADARPPSMIPAVPIVPKSEEFMRIAALEAELAQMRKKFALLEDTLEYLRSNSAWPKEWVLAHGGAVEPGPDDTVDPEQETVEITDGEAATDEPSKTPTQEAPVADETTRDADPNDQNAVDDTKSTSDAG